ncbi:hypothetical protein BR93DRAFT_925061, partial [Coniochaeta sp. PMI_546]
MPISHLLRPVVQRIVTEKHWILSGPIFCPRLTALTPFGLASCNTRATQLRFKVGTGTMGDNGDNANNVEVEEAPFPLTDTDRYVLSLTDEEYQYHYWDELKEIIATNNLAILKRKPSDLRRYMIWTAETKAEYGSMTNYLLAHRLPKAWGRPPFQPASSVPFDDPSDYRVLLNDWPYGFGPGITHIVVWSRTAIATDPETGDMTPESRKIVGDFVKRFFV